jgi:HPt (histidine-containing phosphotransfer) domain-containing protein
MQPQVKPFAFSNQLDVGFLKEVYDGDMEYAADIFEIFLDTIDEERENLKASLEGEDCQEIRACAHKMKPTFSMVGLTDLTEQFKTLETAARYNKLDRVKEIYKAIRNELTEKVPLLIDQQKQLLAHLGK